MSTSTLAVRLSCRSTLLDQAGLGAGAALAVVANAIEIVASKMVEGRKVRFFTMIHVLGERGEMGCSVLGGWAWGSLAVGIVCLYYTISWGGFPMLERFCCENHKNDIGCLVEMSGLCVRVKGHTEALRRKEGRGDEAEEWKWLDVLRVAEQHLSADRAIRECVVPACLQWLAFAKTREERLRGI